MCKTVVAVTFFIPLIGRPHLRDGTRHLPEPVANDCLRIMQAQPHKKYIVLYIMNLLEAKYTIILDIYQQIMHSLLRRYDLEADAKERDKLITRVYTIIDAIQNLRLGIVE